MTTCPDCGVQPGQQHQEGCDVARCVICGLQQLQCNPRAEHGLRKRDWPPMQTWTGEWPGEVECREFGLYARWTQHSGYGDGDVPDTGDSAICAADHPHAHLDLNGLADAAAAGAVAWSRERERSVLANDR